MSELLYTSPSRVPHLPEPAFPAKPHLRDQPTLLLYRLYVREQVQLESEPYKGVTFLDGDRFNRFEEIG